MSLIQLLNRVFDINMAHCQHCSGGLTIVAPTEGLAVIAKIFAHLRLLEPQNVYQFGPAISFKRTDATRASIHSGSAPEPTVPLGLHPLKTPQSVAMLGNILGTGTGEALLARDTPPIFKPLIGIIDTPLLLWYFSARSQNPFNFPIPTKDVRRHQGRERGAQSDRASGGSAEYPSWVQEWKT